MADFTKETPGSQPARYRIQIHGWIRAGWSDWLNGMEISTSNAAGEAPVTTLVGIVPDQAALRGILCRIWDLNLTVLAVLRLEKEFGSDV